MKLNADADAVQCKTSKSFQDLTITPPNLFNDVLGVYGSSSSGLARGAEITTCGTMTKSSSGGNIQVGGTVEMLLLHGSLTMRWSWRR